MSSLEELFAEYPLTQRQKDEYRETGHILLRGVLSEEEVSRYRSHISETVEKFRSEKRRLEERDTYGKAFLQIGNLWRKSEEVQKFVFARRFAQVAAELMGVEGVRMNFDQALFKEPGGGHTPWHQDQIYWPFDTPNTITMWMPLVDTSSDMGTMSFASGSHREGYINKIVISEESQDYYERYIKEKGFPIVSAGDMKAGDATFHAGWTLHFAPGNRTDQMREVMTIVYFADGTKLDNINSRMRQTSADVYFPGLKEGDEANSDQTPLLFRRSYPEAR